MYFIMGRKQVIIILGIVLSTVVIIARLGTGGSIPVLVPAEKTQSNFKIYLTFDDGPSPNTEKALDTLKKYDIKGTFFVIKSDEDDPSTYERIIAEGHSLGLHSFSHNTQKIYRSSQDYIKDFEQLRDYIFKQTGTIPNFCRMVGGSNSRYCTKQMKKEMVEYFNKNGYKCYDWDIDPLDSGAYALKAEDIAGNIINTAKQKPNQDLVILLHDDRIRTTLIEALEIIIPYFIQAGYSFDVLSGDTILNGSTAAIN